MSRRTHDGSSLEATAERQAEMIPQAARLRSRLELPSETESEAPRHSSVTSRIPAQLMTTSGTPSFTGEQQTGPDTGQWCVTMHTWPECADQ